MKYIVMECHRSYAVLLDENGKFVKAANMNYVVGQTVTDPVIMKRQRSRTSTRAAWIQAFGAIAACLILVLGFGYYQNNLFCYSSITMSINPEVRIELNRKGEVIDVVGTNDDGVKLVENYDFHGKDKITVADELISRAREMGYLTDAGDISFDINAPDQKLLEQYSSEISRQVTEYLSNLFGGADTNISNGHITITVEIKKPDGNTDPGGSTNPNDSPSPNLLSIEEVKSIVLDHAKLNAADVVSFSEISLETENGVQIYELEFTSATLEYEYKINALTGAIIEFDSEEIDDD
ncbi:MAG: hypothetical protein E7633_06160 [Ruminococcaceae bacterium]|nr:hypothetical protein [Oscillospiraceae bacterium]